jgi:hypothetical protein
MLSAILRWLTGWSSAMWKLLREVLEATRSAEQAACAGRVRGGERAMSIGSFERYPLLFGPSPVHPLERLSAHLGGA